MDGMRSSDFCEQVTDEQYGDWPPSPHRPIKNRRTDLRDWPPSPPPTTIEISSSPSTTICKSQSTACSAGEAQAPPRSAGRPCGMAVCGDVCGCRDGCRRSREDGPEEKEQGAMVICCGGGTRIFEGRRRRLGWYKMKHVITASKVAQAMELSKKVLSFAGGMAVRGGRLLCVGSYDSSRNSRAATRMS